MCFREMEAGLLLSRKVSEGVTQRTLGGGQGGKEHVTGAKQPKRPLLVLSGGTAENDPVSDFSR